MGQSRWFKIQLALMLAVFMLMGCSTLTGRQSPSAALDDTAITTKVKSSFLADPVVSGLAIDVDTTEGVVSLSGIATNQQERQRAIQLAQSTEGVKGVDARTLVLKR